MEVFFTESLLIKHCKKLPFRRNSSVFVTNNLNISPINRYLRTSRILRFSLIFALLYHSSIKQCVSHRIVPFFLCYCSHSNNQLFGYIYINQHKNNQSNNLVSIFVIIFWLDSSIIMGKKWTKNHRIIR